MSVQLNGQKPRAERVQAPFGRRRAEVVANRASGGYRVFSLLDPTAPSRRPASSTCSPRRAGWDADGERPYLPRAFSVAPRPRRSTAACGSTSWSTPSARAPSGSAVLETGEGVWINGPLGTPFSPPADLVPGAAGAILVGGGIGVAPLAIWRRRLAEAGVPTRVLLGFRDEAHTGAPTSSTARRCGSPARTATPATAATSPTCSACCWRATRPNPPPSTPAARRRCSRPCGRCAPSAASRPSWRWRRRWPAASAPASAAPCRSPAAATCASASTARSSTRRRDRDRAGPGIGPRMSGRSTDQDWFARPRPSRHQRLRHLRRDRRPPRLRRRAARADFPFAAFVSKTITLEPRAGNPPPRLWETPAGMINSIGLPNKGLDGFLADDLPAARRAAGAADRLGDGDEPGGVRAARRGGRGARRGRGARAQRLLPQRPVGPDRRRAAGRDRGAAGGAARPDRQAADRQADPQRRRPGRRRRRRAARWRRRRLADQHAQGDGS